MKREYFILGIVLVAGLILAQEAPADDQIMVMEPVRHNGPDHVLGEIIVKFKAGVSESVIAKINAEHGTSVIYTSPFAGFKRLSVPNHVPTDKMVEAFSKNPNVEYAELNYIVSALMVPNDTYYPYQWHLDNPVYGGIGMEEAWDLATGAGVTVAVIDTGVGDPPLGIADDLEDSRVVAGYDFINNDADATDDHGHGTHVAGTIGQSTNNSLGVAGVAYACYIMPVKVLNSAGSGTDAQVADGIYFAANNGADIINMSLGSRNSSQTLEDAVANAYGQGVTIICASGNDGGNTVLYPAAYDAYCIAVGATGYNETVTFYSNRGTSLDLTAPGGDYTDQNGDGYIDGVLQQTFGFWGWAYYFNVGTSMAAPHVSGVAALLISAGVASGPDEVREVLESTAEDKGDPGWDIQYGHGIVDAYAALMWSSGPTGEPPVADAGGPYSGNEGSVISFDGSGSYGTDGTIVSYEWDFGDGDTGTGVITTHTYADNGTYTVTLTVTDDNGLTDTDTETVTIYNVAPTAEAGGPYSGVEGTPITLTGSATDPGTADTFTYAWDLDNNGTYETPGQIVTKTWANDGSFSVELRVIDDDGGVGTDIATVNVSDVDPVADFSYSPSSPTVGQTVQFTDQSTSYDGITSWVWDFGDGFTSNDPDPTHVYTTDDTYTVTLTVGEDDGDSDTYESLINVVESTEAPSVSTNSATDVTHNSATLNGSLTDLGTATAVDVSFEYGTSSGSYTNETTPETMTGIGSFNADLTGLSANTTYYYRAKAVGDGTSYGDEMQFTTEEEPGAPTMHVGDLDGQGEKLSKGNWQASVTITVHDESHNPVAGATVTGVWSGAMTGTNSGTTGLDGTITFIRTTKGGNSATFTVTNVTYDMQPYNAAANHDPESDSDGTSITISK